jgi:transposase
LARFLLRQGYRYAGKEKWTKQYWRWIGTIKLSDVNLQTVFEESIRAVEQSQEQLKTFDAKLEEVASRPEYARKVERYKTLRGVRTVTAMTIVAEVWDMRAYGEAPRFMSATGLVSSEYSTGEQQRRGSITKTGNAHLRRVLVEAAWHYRHRGKAGAGIQKRRQGQPPQVVAIAERADQRLNRKFHRLVDRYNKKPVVAAVATARELAGFIWAIGQTLE